MACLYFSNNIQKSPRAPHPRPVASALAMLTLRASSRSLSASSTFQVPSMGLDSLASWSRLL